MIVASLTSGAKSTLMCPVTHGPGGTALLLPTSILLGAHNPGSLVSSAGMLPCPYSDHSPLYLSWSLSDIAVLRAEGRYFTSDQDGLCQLLRSFFSDTSSASPCNPATQADLLSNVSVKLSPVQTILSHGKCFAALKGMTHGMTPGCDGLPMGFNLRFWSVIGADLVLVLNSAFASGLICHSQCRGVFTLSFEKGGGLNPLIGDG